MRRQPLAGVGTFEWQWQWPIWKEELPMGHQKQTASIRQHQGCQGTVILISLPLLHRHRKGKKEVALFGMPTLHVPPLSGTVTPRQRVWARKGTHAGLPFCSVRIWQLADTGPRGLKQKILLLPFLPLGGTIQKGEDYSRQKEQCVWRLPSEKELDVVENRKEAGAARAQRAKDRV